ncbi:hypothetical protein HMPREF0541_02097 [Lacticaseibacillus rhamnosus ATCC 21052]|nr:hypothetical protein HMPREF0541_02097 [Lacticaseibacillus rhamnosus ATCC 21052]
MTKMRPSRLRPLMLWRSSRPRPLMLRFLTGLAHAHLTRRV